MIEVEWRVCGYCGMDWKSKGAFNCPVCLSDNTWAVDGLADGEAVETCSMPMLDDDGNPHPDWRPGC